MIHDPEGWTDEELADLSDGARPQNRQDTFAPANRLEPTGPDEATFEIIENAMLTELACRARTYARHSSANAREAVAYLDLAVAIDEVLKLRYED